MIVSLVKKVLGSKKKEKSSMKSTNGQCEQSTCVCGDEVDATTTITTKIKNSHEEIELAAYYKWIDAGQPDGSSLSDWLEAESEIESE